MQRDAKRQRHKLSNSCNCLSSCPYSYQPQWPALRSPHAPISRLRLRHPHREHRPIRGPERAPKRTLLRRRLPELCLRELHLPERLRRLGKVQNPAKQVVRAVRAVSPTPQVRLPRRNLRPQRQLSIPLSPQCPTSLKRVPGRLRLAPSLRPHRFHRHGNLRLQVRQTCLSSSPRAI
jgi:hypothetical protein